MKKVKISKHMKTKAEKILVIGSCGSGKSKFLSQSEELVQIKAKETSTGKIIDLNPNINDTYFDTLICNKFKIGELVLVEGKLPNKWNRKEN